MKRINLIMTSIFLGGILLFGVGLGIAFGEYSSLKYGGEKQIGTEKLEEITLEHKVATGKKAKKTILYNYYGEGDYVIEEDKKVPEGTVRYIITYNPNYVRPEIQFNDYSAEEFYGEENKEYEGEMYIVTNRIVNEVKLFMELKDEVLSDLKNGKISSYLYEPVQKVVVKVNPKTMKYIESGM